MPPPRRSQSRLGAPCENLAHLARYASRPSPSYSAAACAQSQMVGNDGNLYWSVPHGQTYVWKAAPSAAATPKRSAKRSAKPKRSTRRSAKPKRSAKRSAKTSPRPSRSRLGQTCEDLSHLARYANRPSPPHSAAACPGRTMDGNDGNVYRSLAHGKTFVWRRVHRTL
jgi:hypothetical protein